MQWSSMRNKAGAMIKKNIENELSSGARRVTGYCIESRKGSPPIIRFEAEETRANQAGVAELKRGESVGQLLTFMIYVIR